MGITAKEIAKMVGVSEATLSLVLNGKPGISDKMRTRVILRLKELGYSHMIKDQSAAQTLLLEEPERKVITFVLYKRHGELLGMNSFFPMMLDGVERTVRRAGFQLSVINIEKDHIEEQIGYIRDTHCQGFVVFATEMKRESLHYFEEVGLPFVVLDNKFIDSSVCTVKVNNEQGIYLALKHLAEMGHKKVGYLESGVEINSFDERETIAHLMSRDFEMEDMWQYTYKIGYPNEKAEVGMRKILETHSREELPTAFLGDNDLVIAGAIRAVKDFGYKVPEDFSFVGYDDRPICTVVSPKLTTIRLPRERFGGVAIEHLINMILYQESSCIVTSVNGSLVERDTVKNLNET